MDNRPSGRPGRTHAEEAPDAAPERRFEALNGRVDGLAFSSRLGFPAFPASLDRRLAGPPWRLAVTVPEVDLKTLDLLDEDEDRPAGCAQLVPFVRDEAGSPASKRVELLVIEAAAHLGRAYSGQRPDVTTKRTPWPQQDLATGCGIPDGRQKVVSFGSVRRLNGLAAFWRFRSRRALTRAGR